MTDLRTPPPPGDDPRSVRLDALDDELVRVRRLFQRPGYRRRLLAHHSGGLELAMLRLLRVVQRADDAPSVSAVAESLTVDPSTASRLVDRAVESGHLERRACRDDRRRARLHLTTTGRAVLDEVTARRRELLDEVTGEWGPGDVARLTQLLTALRAGFDSLEDPE